MKALRFLAVLVALIFTVVLQTTVCNWISIFNITPDFLLIFLCYQAFRRGPAFGALFGFIIGFSSDIYSPVEWLGVRTIAMTLTGFLVGQLEERFLTLNLIPRIATLAFACLFCDLLSLSLSTLSKQEITHIFLTRSIPECLYTFIFGGVVFYFLFRGNKRIHD